MLSKMCCNLCIEITSHFILESQRTLRAFKPFDAQIASDKVSGTPNHSKSTNRGNRFTDCLFTWDMEHVFEIMEIVILLFFVVFIGVWWANELSRQKLANVDALIVNGDMVLLLSLAGCTVLFGLCVLKIRRIQSSMTFKEVRRTFNDFRFVLFAIGLVMLITTNQIRCILTSDNKSRALWTAHSAVWLVAGMLWCTIDFAEYMSYFVCTAYHLFVFVATSMEFAKVISQIVDPNDNTEVIFRNDTLEYTLYDFKMDGLLLMLMVEIATICTLIRDRRREFYCFGLSHVYRNRMLNLGHLIDTASQFRYVYNVHICCDFE